MSFACYLICVASGCIEDIVTAVFQYLAMVREEGPQEWIFQECAVSIARMLLVKIVLTIHHKCI